MHSEQQNSRDDMRQALHWVRMLASSYAATLEVFLHSGFGMRYLGMRGFVGFALMLLYCLAWPGEDLRPMMMFLLAFFAMCLVARVNGLRASACRVHSQYTGRPHLLCLLPWIGEQRIKRFVEPVLGIVGGALILPLNQPLGFHVMLAAFCQAICAAERETYERMRAMEIRDALIEQRELADRVRALDGDDTEL